MAPFIYRHLQERLIQSVSGEEAWLAFGRLRFPSVPEGGERIPTSHNDPFNWAKVGVQWKGMEGGVFLEEREEEEEEEEDIDLYVTSPSAIIIRDSCPRVRD